MKQGRIVCCLPGHVALYIQANDTSVVDERLRVLDVLRNALGGSVVLVEEKDDRGARDDAHLGQCAFHLDRLRARVTRMARSRITIGRGTSDLDIQGAAAQADDRR